MKTNLYILLLSFSFFCANAQSNSEVVKDESDNVMSVFSSDKQTILIIEDLTIEYNENKLLLIDAFQIKKMITRSSSDIRIYLNRERKVDNIKLVFPKINKVVKA